MDTTIHAYNQQLEDTDKAISSLLATLIDSELPEATSKIWHGHPVWFLEENPIVGYSKEKKGLRLLFWSGADFDEPDLAIRGKKFKDASIYYQSVEEVKKEHVQRWLQKSKLIQWDYKNIVKRKGRLERLK